MEINTDFLKRISFKFDFNDVEMLLNFVVNKASIILILVTGILA